MTKIASMDSNSTPKRLPAEQGKKSVGESFQKEAQDVRNGAPSLIEEDYFRKLRGGPSIYLTRPLKFPYEKETILPKKSGFAMARLVCLLILLSSCSYNLSPTTAQMEQKNFERFKLSPKEAIIYSGSAFAGYGLGKHFVKFKLKD